MRSTLGTLTLAALLVACGGCAGMMESWRVHNCHYDGAYKAGMNDARGGEPMRMGFAHPCAPEVRADAERGYREGYSAGIGGPPGRGPAARGPGWRCEQAYGKRECGFSCVQAYGQIACAKEPHHNCVQAYGAVGCGPNCRAEHGNIVCDW